MLVVVVDGMASAPAIGFWLMARTTSVAGIAVVLDDDARRVAGIAVDERARTVSELPGAYVAVVLARKVAGTPIVAVVGTEIVPAIDLWPMARTTSVPDDAAVVTDDARNDDGTVAVAIARTTSEL